MFLVTTVVALVLLFSYHTSLGPTIDDVLAASGDNAVGIVTGPSVEPDSGASSAPSTSDTGSDSGSTAGETVVNGTVESTRWGPVQVRAVISDGRLTDVVVLQYPQSNGRDLQINSRALPELRSRVLAAQSADVDMVTGATVTSVGYLDSLQAALDMAHFG